MAYSYYFVSKSREAYERYQRTGDPHAYIEFVRYGDLEDLDGIPRFVEEDDANHHTSPYRVNILSEVYSEPIGTEKRRLYPFY